MIIVNDAIVTMIIMIKNNNNKSHKNILNTNANNNSICQSKWYTITLKCNRTRMKYNSSNLIKQPN